MTSVWQAIALGPAARLEAAAAQLREADPPVALAVTIVEAGPDRRRLELLFEAAPDLPRLAALYGLEGDGVTLDAGPLPTVDWVAASLAGLPPVTAGRFRLRGGHSPPARGGQVDLVIEAGEAFGTGHHGTTRGCLLALADVLRRDRPDRVLDLGCGTGALAIAASRVLRAPVLAADIDPVAVRVTTENAAFNQARVIAFEAAGFAHPALRTARFDLVLANILAGPLIGLAGDIARALNPGGRTILSGMLDHQARAVEAAYRARGLTRERRLSLDGWATLTLRKP